MDVICVSSLGCALGRLLEAEVDLGLLRLMTEAVAGKVLKEESVIMNRRYMLAKFTLRDNAN